MEIHPDVTVLVGDSRETLRTLPEASVHCCVTSPPYWGLRDYGIDNQIGLEQTPEAYVAELVEVFREVKRVLRDDGTCWVNLGDSYAGGPTGNIGRNDAGANSETFSPGGGNKFGSGNPGKQGAHNRTTNLKPKDLVGIPWRVAFALQADGWWLRQDIIWHKPNPMPESVTDRCTKSHEYIFLLSKSAKYWYDADAIKEPVSDTSGAAAWRRIFDPSKQLKEAALKTTGRKGGNDGARDVNATHRNRRSVWTVSTAKYSAAHFATFPPDLIEPCILAGCPVGGTVLDPFGGSGTTAGVAVKHNRKAILCELSPEYAELVGDRVRSIAGYYPLLE